VTPSRDTSKKIRKKKIRKKIRARPRGPRVNASRRTHRICLKIPEIRTFAGMKAETTSASSIGISHIWHKLDVTAERNSFIVETQREIEAPKIAQGGSGGGLLENRHRK